MMWVALTVEKEKQRPTCVCSQTRVRLFTESVNNFGEWMKKQDKTIPEVSYWSPLYIKFLGTRGFQDPGRMSPNMTALAKSQDEIGWRNLMEGRLSKHFFKIQSILPFGSTYLNGEYWVKKMISKVLQITHSQWIYRTFSLHDKRRGYLRRQDMKEMMVKIKTLLGTRPDEILKDSQFLLEINHRKLARSNIHDKTYWVVAMEVVIIAGQRTAATATGARRMRIHNKHWLNLTRRSRLGIPEPEERIRLDRFTYGSNNGERPTESKPLSRRQGPSSASITANLRKQEVQARWLGMSLLLQNCEARPHMLVQQYVCGYTFN